MESSAILFLALKCPAQAFVRIFEAILDFFKVRNVPGIDVVERFGDRSYPLPAVDNPFPFLV
jgi:hypothetical protein